VTVLLITVTTAGTVTADLAPGPGNAATYIATGDDLDRFLARHDYHAARGTPVIRLDRANQPGEGAVLFTTHGPLAASHLPPGTAQRAGRSPRIYRGETWQQVGRNANVAIDVYFTLAAQAGIPIEHVDGPP
jgi:hypothetical protein